MYNEVTKWIKEHCNVIASAKSHMYPYTGAMIRQLFSAFTEIENANIKSYMQKFQSQPGDVVVHN